MLKEQTCTSICCSGRIYLGPTQEDFNLASSLLLMIMKLVCDIVRNWLEEQKSHSHNQNYHQQTQRLVISMYNIQKEKMYLLSLNSV